MLSIVVWIMSLFLSFKYFLFHYCLHKLSANLPCHVRQHIYNTYSSIEGHACLQCMIMLEYKLANIYGCGNWWTTESQNRDVWSYCYFQSSSLWYVYQQIACVHGYIISEDAAVKLNNIDQLGTIQAASFV